MEDFSRYSRSNLTLVTAITLSALILQGCTLAPVQKLPALPRSTSNVTTESCAPLTKSQTDGCFVQRGDGKYLVIAG